MAEPNYSHVAFADESNWNRGRFRSISLVSAAVDCARAFHKEMEALRERHGTAEYKWKDIKDHHGIALADFYFARRSRIRVDVLVWDVEDSRHGGLHGRDDKANFARMYYHLLQNVLKHRWPEGASWLVCPDEQKEVDWLTLEECLGWKSWAVEENLFTRAGVAGGIREFYNIHDLRCVSSREFPLVQLADLFAGLATYSRTAFDKYQQWKIDQSATPSFIDFGDCGVERLRLSNSDLERLPILHHVTRRAGEGKLGISLDSSSGLLTRNPVNPQLLALHPAACRG